MKKLFYFIMLFVAISSCNDEPILDREKFMGNYSGTQTVTYYINNELLETDTQVGIESIGPGTFEDQIVIGKGSNNELTATVVQSALSIQTQPVFVSMDDGTTAIFSTTGNGILSGSNLTINLDMKATIDGDFYRYVVKEVLIKE